MTFELINSVIEQGQPLILDGGLGSELEARGYDVSSPLWSAELIRSKPEALLEVHRAYLDAGAHCITTASYQASLTGLQQVGLTADEIKAVFDTSVELACQARDEFLQDNPDCHYRPLVAASVGPYGAYLADGSEYRGNYGLSDVELDDFHRQRLLWFDQNGADLIACETIPDLQEARVLAQILESLSTPCWVSFCCRDETRLHDGNCLGDAATLFKDIDNVFALGVNCGALEQVEVQIRELRVVTQNKTIVVYPNSGAKYDAALKRWYGSESSSQWMHLANDWYQAGAGIIGGCCRIGPGHIDQLASRASWHC
ncbi:MAG: homocysteine S-methyltransferase [Gammaproteobacteria bacterium]|nr:homocysteine S-methyltransferase [Gammaproteobacteria bacterium]